MPRKSKQQPTSVTSPGQPYGIAGEQQAAMNMVPLPDTQVAGSMDAPISSDMGGSAPMGASESAPNSMQMAIQEALMSPSPDAAAFSAPTTRPNESIFTPAAPSIARPSDLGNIFRALAEDSGGDPVFLQLAAQADEQRL
jgi:hypothetical protein